MGKILHQQEIHFVAIRVAAHLLMKIVAEQGTQGLIASQIRSLKKLPELVDLYSLIYVQQPLAGEFD
jgi:hypothetical protein